MNQYYIPGYGIFNEGTPRQFYIPGYGLITLGGITLIKIINE